MNTEETIQRHQSNGIAENLNGRNSNQKHTINIDKNTSFIDELTDEEIVTVNRSTEKEGAAYILAGMDLQWIFVIPMAILIITVAFFFDKFDIDPRPEIMEVGSSLVIFVLSTIPSSIAFYYIGKGIGKDIAQKKWNSKKSTVLYKNLYDFYLKKKQGENSKKDALEVGESVVNRIRNGWF
ncbi:MAG: hypothetical protein MUD00_02920 [Candidatus Pacebacteria bacterium]|jgi:hypothetical protein|nr:hypothetical protein [Candidatus Paceibacterota bacterium]